jgi:hypothetical protein
MTLHRWQRVFGVLTIVLTSIALALTLVPSLVETVPSLVAVLETLARIEADTFGLLAGAALVALLSVLVVVSPSPTVDTTDRFTELRTHPPEAVTVTEATQLGAAFDARVNRAVRGQASMDPIRSRLVDLACDVHVARTGLDPAVARKAVRTGRWTTDRTAAAFLAADGPSHSLWSRLRLWLDPDTERRRRIDTTVAAIRDHAERESL